MTVLSVRLGDIAEQITDGTHLSPNYVDSGIPMIDSKHIKNNFCIDDSDAEKFISIDTDKQLSQKCKPVAGDILISSRGTIGKIAIVKLGQNFNIMGNMILVRLGSSVDKRFFLHYLRRSLGHLISLSRGVAQKGLYLNQVRDLIIKIPLLAEQQRIATLLDTVDHTLNLRESAISKLNRLPQSIFVDMFGDPLNNPMNFELVKVRDICKLVNGLAFKPTEWKESGKPIIRIQNLNGENKPFNYTQENFDKKYLVKNGDVLFSWSGTPGTSFGCFKWLREDGWLNQHIFKVILNGKLITVDFFITQMNLKIGELISQAHGGVGLKHVTKKMVDELSLVLPPMKLQLDFCKRVSKFEKIQRIYKNAFVSTKLLQSSLQHKSFAVN